MPLRGNRSVAVRQRIVAEFNKEYPIAKEKYDLGMRQDPWIGWQTGESLNAVKQSGCKGHGKTNRQLAINNHLPFRGWGLNNQ